MSQISLASSELDRRPSAFQQLTANPYFAAVSVFLFFAVVFLSLRTQQYLDVDGALRSLDVYHRPELFFHGNNHLLYPVNVFLWSQALARLGLKAQTPFQFIALSQAMNAIAAAACLALLYILVWIATSSVRLALVVVSAYGFSRAFLLHATNSAEPVVGLFYSTLAMLLVVESLRRRWIWLLGLGGACFGLAMASYQSMVLLTPAGLLLCLSWPADKAEPPSLHARVMRFCSLSFGALIAVCAAYGSAYSRSGATTIPQMIHRILTVDGGREVYGHFSLAKLVNPPFGLISALVPALPADYAGIRSLWREPHNMLWIASTAITLVWLCGVFWLVARPTIAKWRMIDYSQRVFILALLLCLIILLAPLTFWDPLYDKLWLQPLGLILFLLAMLYHTGSSHIRRRTVTILALSFIALEATSNLAWAVQGHLKPTRGVVDARVIADLISPNDLIVLNFDDLSMLYLTLWGSPRNSLLLPASTLAQVSNRIDQQIREARVTGGSIYFLSVLDMSEEAWTNFLGNRVGLSYKRFELFRREAIIVESFKINNTLITLRKLTCIDRRCHVPVGPL